MEELEAARVEAEYLLQEKEQQLSEAWGEVEELREVVGRIEAELLELQRENAALSRRQQGKERDVCVYVCVCGGGGREGRIVKKVALKAGKSWQQEIFIFIFIFFTQRKQSRGQSANREQISCKPASRKRSVVLRRYYIVLNVSQIYLLFHTGES